MIVCDRRLKTFGSLPFAITKITSVGAKPRCLQETASPQAPLLAFRITPSAASSANARL